MQAVDTTRDYPGSMSETDTVLTDAPRKECLNVSRFGWGYWIGVISTMIFGLLWDGTIPEEVVRKYDSVNGIFVLVVLGGMIMSVVQFFRGVGEKNKNRSVGGAIGFLLCFWPFALGAVTPLQASTDRANFGPPRPCVTTPC